MYHCAKLCALNARLVILNVNTFSMYSTVSLLLCSIRYGALVYSVTMVGVIDISAAVILCIQLLNICRL